MLFKVRGWFDKRPAGLQSYRGTTIERQPVDLAAGTERHSLQPDKRDWNHMRRQKSRSMRAKLFEHRAAPRSVSEIGGQSPALRCDRAELNSGIADQYVLDL